MEHKLTTWKEVIPQSGIWQATYNFPGGLSRSLIIDLGKEHYLVFSPGASLVSEAQKTVLKNARQIYLLEPNSFHNLGLTAWKNSFKGARLFSSSGALKRLTKKTQLSFEDLDTLLPLLPDHVKICVLPHNKIGEIWLHVNVAGKSILVTGDAFMNFSTLATKGLLKWFMRLNRMGPGLEMTRIFLIFALGNKRSFVDWVDKTLNSTKPTVLIPCHGGVLIENNLSVKIADLVKKRCGA